MHLCYSMSLVGHLSIYLLSLSILSMLFHSLGHFEYSNSMVSVRHSKMADWPNHICRSTFFFLLFSCSLFFALTSDANEYSSLLRFKMFTFEFFRYFLRLFCCWGFALCFLLYFFRSSPSSYKRFSTYVEFSFSFANFLEICRISKDFLFFNSFYIWLVQ